MDTIRRDGTNNRYIKYKPSQTVWRYYEDNQILEVMKAGKGTYESTLETGITKTHDVCLLSRYRPMQCYVNRADVTSPSEENSSPRNTVSLIFRQPIGIQNIMKQMGSMHSVNIHYTELVSNSKPTLLLTIITTLHTHNMCSITVFRSS